MALQQWPTLLVCLLIYGLFFGLTWFWQALPLPLLALAGGLVVAWYGSLEHEVIHGHPTRWPWVNRALVLPPLLVWLPHEIYAQSHRAHHRDSVLTDPFDDPESYYMAQGRWDTLAPWQRHLFGLCNTLLGRLTLGVLVSIWGFWHQEARALIAGEGQRWRIWARHLGLCAGLLAYLVGVCALPIWVYLVCFVLPGTALTLLRAFLEHQYAEDPKHRTAIVEASWFWRLLFLNNCYHLIHHQNPALPWYRLPGEYAQHRQAYQALNGGYLVPGYASILRNYGLRAKEPVRHPVR